MSLILVGAGLLAQAPAGQGLSPVYELGSLPLTIDTPLPDWDLAEHTFFFLAEENWLAINTDLQWGFLSYLHAQAQVRTLVVERGYCFAHHINRYLQSGEEAYLERALFSLPTCPEDQWDFYRNLRAFNQQQSSEGQIQVVGIDLEFSPLLVLHTLRDLLPAGTPPARMQERECTLQALTKEADPDAAVLKAFLRDWFAESKGQQRAYKRYWGEQYGLFEMIRANSLQAWETPWLRDFAYAYGDPRKREARMYQNFRRLAPHLPAGSYFAPFEAVHTELAPTAAPGYATLAQQLQRQKSSPVRHQVLTISKYMHRSPSSYPSLPNEDRFLAYLDALQRASSSPLLLLDLRQTVHRFPRIARAYPFLLVIDPALEKNICR